VAKRRLRLPAVGRGVPSTSGGAVEKRVDEGSGERKCLIERFRVWEEGFRGFGGVADLPSFPVGNVEAGGECDGAACFLGAQCGGLVVGVDGCGGDDGDEVDEVAVAGGGLAVAVWLEDRCDLVGDVVDEG
jgi:hypothetical protein